MRGAIITYHLCVSLCGCCPRPDLRQLHVEADILLLQQGYVRCHGEQWSTRTHTEGVFAADAGVAVATEDEPVITFTALVEALGR